MAERRKDPKWDADHYGQGEGHEAELHGGHEAVRDEVVDAAVLVAIRGTQVTLDEAGRPS